MFTSYWAVRALLLVTAVAAIALLLALWYAPRVIRDAKADAENGIGTFWRNVWEGYKGVAADWSPFN